VLRPAGLRDKNAKEESKDLEICALECAPTRKSGGVLPHAFLLRKMVTNLDDLCLAKTGQVGRRGLLRRAALGPEVRARCSLDNIYHNARRCVEEKILLKNKEEA